MPLPLLGSVAAGHRTIRFLFLLADNPTFNEKNTTQRNAQSSTEYEIRPRSYIQQHICLLPAYVIVVTVAAAAEPLTIGWAGREGEREREKERERERERKRDIG
jgi:hypothetical protein